MSDPQVKNNAKDVNESDVLAHELTSETANKNEPQKEEKDTSNVCCGSCS